MRDMHTGRELRDFLTSRRASLTPEEVGLPPSHSHRRVKGLRREEVAILAGVSVDYYVKLEQGRVGNISEQVLASIEAALRLDELERKHLRSLLNPDSGHTPRPAPTVKARHFEVKARRKRRAARRGARRAAWRPVPALAAVRRVHAARTVLVRRPMQRLAVLAAFGMPRNERLVGRPCSLGRGEQLPEVDLSPRCGFSGLAFSDQRVVGRRRSRPRPGRPAAARRHQGSCSRCWHLLGYRQGLGHRLLWWL
jgi:transcriptional regulator with XRE-family HTH domain